MSITHSVWTQLEKKNEWIYFIPSRDSITILCPDKEPIDIALHGAGKLSIQAGCKGYSQSALLQTTSVIQVNTSKFGGDLLSKVQSHYDCGENLGNSINFSSIDLDMRFKHVVTNIDDLKLASFKISELENLLKKQEWKNAHMSSHATYSAFVYIIVEVIALYGFFKLYKIIVYHLKRNKNLRAIAAAATDHIGLPTDADGSGNVVNIHIKTSNESLAMTPEAIPLQSMEQCHTNPEPTGSKRVRSTKSCFKAQLRFKLAFTLMGEVLHIVA